MAAAPGQLTMEQWKKRSNFLRALRWLTTNRDEDLTPEALIEQFTVYVQENARTGKVTAQMNHDVVFFFFQGRIRSPRGLEDIRNPSFAPTSRENASLPPAVSSPSSPSHFNSP